MATYQLLLGGTATLGEDYEISTNLIELGLTNSVDFVITPIEDELEEGEETIILSMLVNCEPIPYFSNTIYLKDALALTTNTNISLCEPNVDISLSASGAETYSWVPSTGLSCTDCPNPTANITEDITYTVFGEIAGCIDQKIIEITIDPEFNNATITPAQSICETESLTLEATGGITYLWQSNDEANLGYLSCTDCPNPIFQPQVDMEATFEYDVLIGRSLNCDSTAFYFD